MHVQCSFTYFLLSYATKSAISLILIMYSDVISYEICILCKLDISIWKREKLYERSRIVILSDLGMQLTNT